MTSKELCAILNASKGTKIKEIKMKDFHLKFDNLTNDVITPNNSTNVVLSDVSGPNMPEVLDVKDLERESKVASDINEEFYLANMMAQDPEAFEKHQRGL